MTGQPVAVCGTAGAGTAHLFNGLMDARKERAPVIAIAGDVETSIMDTSAFEELNPYKLFDAAALYIGRLVNPQQAPAVIGTALRTAVIDQGPTVISIPGDVAASDAPAHLREISVPVAPVLRPADQDVEELARMINDAGSIAIFGGDGC